MSKITNRRLMELVKADCPEEQWLRRAEARALCARFYRALPGPACNVTLSSRFILINHGPRYLLAMRGSADIGRGLNLAVKREDGGDA